MDSVQNIPNMALKGSSQGSGQAKDEGRTPNIPEANLSLHTKDQGPEGISFLTTPSTRIISSLVWGEQRLPPVIPHLAEATSAGCYSSEKSRNLPEATQPGDGRAQSWHPHLLPPISAWAHRLRADP